MSAHEFWYFWRRTMTLNSIKPLGYYGYLGWQYIDAGYCLDAPHRFREHG